MRSDDMRAMTRLLLAALLLAAPSFAFAQNAGGIPADVLRIVTPITVGDCLQVSKNTVPYAAADAGAPCGTGGGGGGTVTSFSFLNGDGFNGTVLNASTTPTLSLAPSFTGFAYSNGTGFSAASTTGSGNLVLANSPTLVTPNLGTPSAINLLNGLGLPFSGLATGTLTTGTLTIGTGAILTYSGTGVLNANQIGGLNWPTPISGNCLTTNGTALLWGTCGGAGTSFEVNGTATAASNPINFLDSALTDGLTLTFANPSAGNVQLGLTGTLSTAGGGTGLSALTQYSLLSGGASTANLIAPSATVGEALISNGTTAQPGYSTALPGVTSVNGTTIPAASTLLYSGGALGTPSSGVGTNITGVNAASVGGFTLPCTVPSLVSGDYLTNNGSTCSWAAVSGSGTMTDGTGTTVVGAIPYSSTTAHAYSLLASPTSGAGIYSVQFDPTSTTAVAPTVDQVGVASRSISGATTTDTVLYSDVLGLIVHDKAATGAVNETLPTPATLGNTKFGYTYCNDSAQTDTITPTTYTIAVNGGAAGASITVGTGICAQISVEPFTSTQWDAFTYGASSGGSAAFSAITTGTNTAATMTVGTGATITVTGSGVNNANQVNGAAVATSAAALASNSSGQIIAATTTTYLIDSGTAFTLGTGTGACATDAVVSGSGAATGAVTCSGTTGAATLVVNLPTATIWACTATDITHPATIPESAYTTTSVTFTAASVTSGDTITLSCTGST